ncbi:MAG TPA: anti-sigma factor [Acetobacteraceae bacterium]|jgi:anti-sigma factor RsiW
MNRPIRPVQEDELHGFVDGRLDPARHAEIAALLTQDPRLQQRVADWQAQQALLREAMAFKAREPVPPSLHLGRLMDARLARRSVPWRMAAGFVLCLMLGGAGGWVMRGQQRPSDMMWLTRQAASAHRVFATDEIRPTELGSGDRTQLVDWISQRLGHHVDVPDLSRLGYHFMGGRLLAAVGGPAAMLMYGDGAGNRVTVYVQPMHGPERVPMRQVESAGNDTGAVGGFAWINGQVGYGVMAAAASPALHVLANTVRDAMAKPG